MHNPLVSVIMGVYNCEATLEESLESIATQTYSNWELIVCDDGSTDNTFQLAEAFASRFPDRCHLLQNATNRGLAHGLNRCIAVANGSYLARQDGDDISLPQRLSVLVDALEGSQPFAIASSPMLLFDAEGIWGQTSAITAPETHDLARGTPFAHAATLMRASAVRSVGGYSEAPAIARVEDYDLWIRMYRAGFRGFNLERPYYKMRDDRSAMKRRLFSYRINEMRLRFSVISVFNLPWYCYFHAVRPVLVGLLPDLVYFRLRRHRLSIAGRLLGPRWRVP